MSNLIKSNYVYIRPEQRKIDSDAREDWQQRFSEAKKAMNSKETLEDTQFEFVAGISTINLENIIEEEVITESAEDIIAKAHKEANVILEEAKAQAQAIKISAHEDAKQAGYQEGYKSGMDVANTVKEQYEQRLYECSLDYDKMVNELEPQFVKLLVDYITKITGVMAEDHKEIIYYLVHRGIHEMGKSKNFTVRLSKADYSYLIARKEKLMEILQGNVELDFLEDEELLKNQCIIESDSRIADCSLDVQLNNLISNLKLLARI